MSNINVLFVGNDNILEVSDLKNELTGADLNAATVTVTLKDAAGANVTGDTWPKTMTYVTGSKGTYRTTLLYSMPLTAGDRYNAVISANGGAGLQASWTVECVARARN